MKKRTLIIVTCWFLAVLLVAPTQLRLAHVGLAEGPDLIDSLHNKRPNRQMQLGSVSNDMSVTLGRDEITLLEAYKRGVESLEDIRKRHILILKAMLIIAPLLFIWLGHSNRKEREGGLYTRPPGNVANTPPQRPG